MVDTSGTFGAYAMHMLPILKKLPPLTKNMRCICTAHATASRPARRADERVTMPWTWGNVSTAYTQHMRYSRGAVCSRLWPVVFLAAPAPICISTAYTQHMPYSRGAVCFRLRLVVFLAVPASICISTAYAQHMDRHLLRWRVGVRGVGGGRPGSAPR